MIRQIKYILLSTGLFLIPFAVSAQDSVIRIDETKIDSLHEIINLQIEQRLKGLMYQFQQKLNQQNLIIDSLEAELQLKNSEIQTLFIESGSLKERISETDQSVSFNKRIIDNDRKSFKRVFLIAGLSFFTLFMVAVLLFYLLIMKQQDQTEKKINVIRKFIRYELDETRNDLLMRMKRKLVKLKSDKKRKNSDAKKRKVKNKKTIMKKVKSKKTS